MRRPRRRRPSTTRECPLLAQSRHELVYCTCPLSGVKRTCLATGLSAWSKAAVGENGAAFGLAKRNDTYFLPFVSGASKIELTASLEIRPSMR